MDVAYINPFISASMKVCWTIAYIEPLAGTPAAATSLKQTGFVNGYIGLEGHGISGYLVINFSRFFLKQAVRRIFGPGIGSTDQELFDACGELTNIISGVAKAELSNRGFFFDDDVPRISAEPPEIPEHLKKNPIIVVPFDSKAGPYTIQASILKIEEDFVVEKEPEISPPEGTVSVARFSELTGMAEIKVRRFLKTGFLKGDKVSRMQWHIPVEELEKIQGRRVAGKSIESAFDPKTDAPPGFEDDHVSITEFSKLSGLPTGKIKRFLRSGFLSGLRDKDENWHLKKADAAKFKRNGR